MQITHASHEDDEQLSFAVCANKFLTAAENKLSCKHKPLIAFPSLPTKRSHNLSANTSHT